MKIGLIGIGESGRDTVVNFYERYKEQDVFGMEIAVVDTDVMALAKFDKEHRKDRRIQKILVGKKTLKGMDPERRPDLAYIASVESEKNLVKFMKGMDFVFFAVSLGETVGAGLTPAILKAARKAGATPIIVVTLPPNIKDNFQTQTALHAVNSILRQVGNGAMVYSNSDFNDVD
jgi:cell division GTPase FtsZ